MDRIEKALARLSSKERIVVRTLLLRIQKGELNDLNVKKLKGRGDIFRVRKGTMRIIFRIAKAQGISVLSIERRSEKTYREH